MCVTSNTVFLIFHLIAILVVLLGLLVAIILLLPDLISSIQNRQNKGDLSPDSMQAAWQDLKTCFSTSPRSSRIKYENGFEKQFNKLSSKYSLGVLANMLNIKSGLVLFIPDDTLGVDCCRQSCESTKARGERTRLLKEISLEQKLEYLDLSLSRYKDSPRELYKSKRQLKFKFFGDN